MTVAFCLFRKERDFIWVYLQECLSPEISLKTERRAAPTPFTWADVVFLTQGLDEFLDVAVMDYIALGGHKQILSFPNVIRHMVTAHTDKAKSTEKIDGAVATIMALDRAIRCGNTNSASVYDDRGILFI